MGGKSGYKTTNQPQNEAQQSTFAGHKINDGFVL